MNKEELIRLSEQPERSACGVGFLVNLKKERSHSILQQALQALECVEHRGACSWDNQTGDGTGILTEIPFELFGYDSEHFAVASLFTPSDPERKAKALQIFEETFRFFELEVYDYRKVPTNDHILGPIAEAIRPGMVQAFIKRPAHCRTRASFDKLLYQARQVTRIKERAQGIYKEFFFVSLSTHTIVYKALTKSSDLARFYPDLLNPEFKTQYALFHRRFSTNTVTAWDKVQPFRLLAHNGEINTISGNRSWSHSRAKDLGLREDELLTKTGISDTGSLNEMIEALLYRSTLPDIDEVLAITVPPAARKDSFYKLWSRGLEPWDGPALLSFSDGIRIGARLDRNGFRPCRWAMTQDTFYLSSEAGSFQLNEADIRKKGSLRAGRGVSVHIDSGRINFEDPAQNAKNFGATFDARLISCVYPDERIPLPPKEAEHLDKKALFLYSKEDIDQILAPMIMTGKEPIGSMGDTAPPAILSDEPRLLYDYFYQNFAQVTNPPLDYIREEMVTDLTTYLGRKPNVFKPTALIPPPIAIELTSPFMTLAQFRAVKARTDSALAHDDVRSGVISMTYERKKGAEGLQNALDRIEQEAMELVAKGISILILSDEKSTFEELPVPALLALRVVVNHLNQKGEKLAASVVMHTAEVRNTHQASSLIGFGATAVCPYLALEIARYEANRAWDDLSADQRETNLIHAFEQGLLKVMSKMGISVSRSYQSSKLFTAIGLDKAMAKTFFPGVPAFLGGLTLEDLAIAQERRMSFAESIMAGNPAEFTFRSYQFKEQNKGLEGERHAMTAARSKLIHELVQNSTFSLKDIGLYEEYLKVEENSGPFHVRDLFGIQKADQTLRLEDVEPASQIMKRFGSGAMSFGAISAEAQRDIFLAMKEIGGRSNSGEGGENPYYYTNGVSATAKQIASARFGVTAEYLMAGNEFQIKIAQGAKPGEGGQLMGIKVTADIARARHSVPGRDLISPPPLHDIYSIEDLKELIYELKQLKPDVRVNVKLVSGAHIGMIAVGVAKAGADIIHVSGGDGGTGAASISSMKHAGLPWEFGLWEVHRTLVENKLRNDVILRTDGGLATGRDLVIAAILGAEEFEFGKLLLIAEGCIMARICEKNTCPRGIATHDPKFKAKYVGQKDHIVRLMQILAEDVRRHLALLGIPDLLSLVGRAELLTTNPRFSDLIAARNLDLSMFVQSSSLTTVGSEKTPNAKLTSSEKVLIKNSTVEISQPDHELKVLAKEPVSELNERLTQESGLLTSTPMNSVLELSITARDRAVGATLSGLIADRIRKQRLDWIEQGNDPVSFVSQDIPTIDVTFRGSAGQGFGVFMTQGLSFKLLGEANDSVGKSMSGGEISIRPVDGVRYAPHENAIIGNVALYGATAGSLFVNGMAGDRFAVRNSGAVAVVEGVGLHACEYMTGGTVVILGRTSENIGAGMTGGQLYVYLGREIQEEFSIRPFESARERLLDQVNGSFLEESALSASESTDLKQLLEFHNEKTDSPRAGRILANWTSEKNYFIKFLPLKLKDQVAEEEIPALSKSSASAVRSNSV